MEIVVKWETLNGNVKTKTFDNWEMAEKFAYDKERASGIQWVDINEYNYRPIEPPC